MRVIAGGGGIAIESGTGGLSAFGGTGSGVSAHADTTGYGVYGDSVGGIGVHGTAFGDKPGVDGFSNNGHGVHGAAANSTVAGTVGRNNGDGTGVIGFTGGGTFPAGKPKTGVYGQAAKDADSRGVWGYSPTGQGVRGQATSGIGVRGLVTTGVGLSGEATTGYALRTKGRVKLDQSAGQATIASGTSSVVVTPGVDLTTTSAVVATLNGDAGGSTTVKRVAINTTANTFTIYLTANATASVKLAWIVLG